jgi:hypothetical protein
MIDLGSLLRNFTTPVLVWNPKIFSLFIKSLESTLHRQFAYYFIFNIDLLLAQYNLLFFYTALSTYSTLSSLLSYIWGKKSISARLSFGTLIFFVDVFTLLHLLHISTYISAMQYHRFGYLLMTLM